MTRPPRPTCILLKDGVAASCLALPHWPRQRARPARLLDYLAERLPVLSQQEWAERMAQGEVLDERGQPLAATAPFVDGARIYYWRWLADEPEIPFEACVIHRDEHLLIVDKPHFLPVTPGGRYARQTLMARLEHIGQLRHSRRHRFCRRRGRTGPARAGYPRRAGAVLGHVFA